MNDPEHHAQGMAHAAVPCQQTRTRSPLHAYYFVIAWQASCFNFPIVSEVNTNRQQQLTKLYSDIQRLGCPAVAL